MNETVPTKSAANGGGTERSVLAVLERLDRRLAHLEAAVERIEAHERTLPNALATATDTFDGMVERLRDRGIDVDQRLFVLLDVAERLTSPEALEAVNKVLDKIQLVKHLLDSDIVAETTVDVVGKAGYALAAARSEPAREVGLWGAARAMSDEDVKRAVGFLVRVAQLFGRSLEEAPTPLLTEGGRS